MILATDNINDRSVFTQDSLRIVLKRIWIADVIAGPWPRVTGSCLSTFAWLALSFQKTGRPWHRLESEHFWDLMTSWPFRSTLAVQHFFRATLAWNLEIRHFASTKNRFRNTDLGLTRVVFDRSIIFHIRYYVHHCTTFVYRCSSSSTCWKVHRTIIVKVGEIIFLLSTFGWTFR